MKRMGVNVPWSGFLAATRHPGSDPGIITKVVVVARCFRSNRKPSVSCKAKPALRMQKQSCLPQRLGWESNWKCKLRNKRNYKKGNINLRNVRGIRGFAKSLFQILNAQFPHRRKALQPNRWTTLIVWAPGISRGKSKVFLFRAKKNALIEGFIQCISFSACSRRKSPTSTYVSSKLVTFFLRRQVLLQLL